MRKNSKFKLNPLYFVIILIVTLALSISLQSLIAAWQAPTAAPPDGNVYAPLNVSSATQGKSGTLVLNTVGNANGLIVDQGRVGIGTINPGHSLDVAGNINFTGDLYKNGSLFSAADSDWTINGNNMYSGVSGSVGIGTNNPSYKFEVYGDSARISGPTIASWDVSTASYTGLNKYISTNNGWGIAFSSDGSRMYVVDYSMDRVTQYSLATAWNVSTASYNNEKYVGSQDNDPFDITFSSDGSKMYIMGVGNKTVYQYTLTTPWNVQTASYASLSKYVGNEEATPYEVAFSQDGSKMYIIGTASKSVFQYNLVTPWNVSTATYSSYRGIDRDSAPYGIAFSQDGSKMYILGQSNRTVYQYSLSTPWAVSTASYASLSKNVWGQDSYVIDIAFSIDGSNMYISGSNNATVYQYSLYFIPVGGNLYVDGKVGIGTTSPTKTLEVIGDVKANNYYGWNVPIDVKQTSAGHDGNFFNFGGADNGYEGINNFVRQDTSCGNEYHACDSLEVARWLQKGNTIPDNGWVIIADYSTEISECFGWESNLSSHYGISWGGQSNRYFVKTACNGINRVLCCK